MEAVDPEPVRALARAGASRLGQIVVGVWPQVRAQWVGYGLFRFECAMRSASTSSDLSLTGSSSAPLPEA